MSILTYKKDREFQRIDRKLDGLMEAIQRLFEILEKVDSFISPELEAEIREVARRSKAIDLKVKDV